MRPSDVYLAAACYLVYSHIVTLCYINSITGRYFVQTMNILIVNQSVVDMCASFFTLLTAVVEVDGTHMSSDNIYDQFLCHIWLARHPLFDFLSISTYGILLMAMERYISVVHPIWQNNNVRTECVNDVG